MAEKKDSKTKLVFRALEILLAVGLLLAILELVLIQRSAHVVLPQVKLVERTDETLVVTLPAGASTNASVLTAPAAARLHSNQPETVTIVRSVPPLLAFENLRRLLGLLGPAQPETIMAYRRNETEHTVNLTGNQAQAKQRILIPPTNTLGAGAATDPSGKPVAAGGEKAKPSLGDPFRISLPQ